MRIIFMGTPEFAVPSLEAVVKAGFNIVGVITAPDRVGGRGKKAIISPVKQAAEAMGLPILQPSNLKSPEFLEELKSYRPDLQIVVAFRMLPEAVWSLPPLGTFNLHASLLPRYRGAAPINWAIINGEEETGVTTFFLKHEIDTGSIIFQVKEAIYPEDTAGDLYERLRQKGAKLVVRTIEAIMDHDPPRNPQDLSGDYPAAPKIFKETCEINWQWESDRLYNFVRGLAPYPAAWTTFQGKQCKIFKISPHADHPEAKILQAGEWLSDHKSFLFFKTGDGLVAIEELQMEGKKRMDIRAFLAGARLS